ncbi:MAG: hypothetical protein V3U54_08760 [Thermodesulfobacteriota bacterium]
MNQLPDILNVECTGCQASLQKRLGVGMPCSGCEIKELMDALNKAKAMGYPIYDKKYLIQWIIGRASQPMPTINNLHAIALVEHYELNR